MTPTTPAPQPSGIALAEPEQAVPAADPFERGRSGKVPGGGTWSTYRQPKGASFNPWHGELRIPVDRNLSDIETDDQAREFAVALGDRLLALPFTEHDLDFDAAVDYLRSAENLDDINGALSEIYDWADQRRYIVEFRP